VGAEKKIELQDIEDDNLKSEKEKELDKSEPRSEADQTGLLPLEFLKNGLLRYFEAPTHGQQPQQQRFVQQYAVTEPPERPSVAAPKPTYQGLSATQQAMVGYLSNVPMQIYLVPQYYNDQSEQAVNANAGVQYAAPAMTRLAYHTGPEVQPQANYIEVPAYVTPTGKTYLQQYSSPVAYVSYAPQPTVPPTQAPVTPVLVPVVQYPTALVAPPVATKGYYQNAQYETNAVDDTQDNEEEQQKQYVTQTEAPYIKPTAEYPRYYSSRTPIREDFRHSSISELPAPNPLLLKASPSHLSHLPKALPMFRPVTKQVYASGNLISNAYTQRPNDAYGVPFKRRPTSLLDSYIPSSIQLEYLKRGYAKDPLAVYDALANGRHFGHSGQAAVIPRHYERGFLPNQMYHTGAGGVTYGHYKRTPKADKAK
jgi:hypothetical protein